MDEMICFEHVKKKFNKNKDFVVNDISFTVSEGELITILGSSGCGKTTTLKMINRLYEPDEGSIFLKGKDIKNIDVIELRRSIGYVIQQNGLFPHLTVKENMLVVPELLKWSKEKKEQRLQELFRIIQLDQKEYQNRYPRELSGGQLQRIGLARALAVSPQLVLLDEPFGALDAITRTLLQDELKRMQKELKATMLFVTHDISEAFKLGDRVMIMNEGKICQFDTPKKIIENPANDYVGALINSYRRMLCDLNEEVFE